MKNYRAWLWVLCLSVVLKAGVGLAGTYVWTGADSTDWFDPGNWVPTVVPTPFDTVNITNAFITLTQPVTQNGVINLEGGTLGGNPLMIGASGILNLTGTNDVNLQLVLTNAGTVNWLGALNIHVELIGDSMFGAVIGICRSGGGTFKATSCSPARGGRPSTTPAPSPSP